MAAKEKICILFFLFLFIFLCTGHNYGILANGKLTKIQKEINLDRKDVMMQKSARKLIGEYAMVDYYEGGPNPAHEPGKGKSKTP